MPAIDSAYWVKQMRIRKGWSKLQLMAEMGASYNISISRVERGKQKPRPGAMRSMNDVLGTQVDELILPALENQSLRAYSMRQQLIYALDKHDIAQAEALLAEFKLLPGFGTPINRQFILSKNAHLRYLQGISPKILILEIKKAIKLTLKNYDEKNFGDVALVCEEPQLFHLLAKTYARAGDFPSAIQILRDIRKGLINLPFNDRERETMLAPVLLTLAKYQYRTKDYDGAVESCELGLHISATQCHGKFTPDFMYIKALCLWEKKENTNCLKYLQYAYFGYELLHKRGKAQEVLALAVKFNLIFDTYGVEKLEYTQDAKTMYKTGTLTACNTITAMIKVIREQSGLKQKDLYRGLCTKGNYSKLENGETDGNIQYIEPIIQRMGWDCNLHCNFFLSSQEFEEKEKRDKIHQLFINRHFNQVGELLKELEGKPSFTTGANLQFIKMSKATLYAVEHGYTDEYLQMLLDALDVTWANFNENDIGKLRMHHYETVLINQIAGHYTNKGDIIHAEKMYEKLLYCITNHYVDETEMAKHYATVSYNYSSCLGKLGRRQKAMGVLEEAIKFERERDRLFMLPNLAYNWAYNLLMTDNKSRSISYFALAYYGCAMFSDFGKEAFRSFINDKAMEHFGINFD